MPLLNRSYLQALLDVSARNERIYYAFEEMRRTHPKLTRVQVFAALAERDEFRTMTGTKPTPRTMSNSYYKFLTILRERNMATEAHSRS